VKRQTENMLHRSMPRVLPTRREFLWQSGGGLALACMLGRESALAQEGLPGGKLHAKAKRVVHFFMAGAASHIDLFDYKPELVKRDGLQRDGDLSRRRLAGSRPFPP
jgi:Protein of unknown function (DUF1501)